MNESTSPEAAPTAWEPYTPECDRCDGYTCIECQVAEGTFDNDPDFLAWEAAQESQAAANVPLVTFNGRRGGILYADLTFAPRKNTVSQEVLGAVEILRAHYETLRAPQALQQAPVAPEDMILTFTPTDNEEETDEMKQMRVAAEENAKVLETITVAGRVSTSTLAVLNWHVKHPMDSTLFLRGYFSAGLTADGGPCEFENMKFTKWGTVKVNLRMKNSVPREELVEIRREAILEQANLAKAFARAAGVQARDLAVCVSVLAYLDPERPAAR